LASPTKTAAEVILKDHGLHKIIVSFSIVLSRNKFHLNLSKECLLVHSQFWSISCCLLWYTAFWWHRKMGKASLATHAWCPWEFEEERGIFKQVCQTWFRIYSPKVRLLTFCLKHETGAFMAKSEAFWLNYNNGFLRWPGVPWCLEGNLYPWSMVCMHHNNIVWKLECASLHCPIAP